MKQSQQNIVNRSNVFENQPGVLNQSQISQTPFGVREIISSEYPKDSTVVKLISSNAPGAVTQVNTTYGQGFRHTPSRQQRTIVRRSESPVRYITESISPGRSIYRSNHQIPISAVVKEQVPLYIIDQQPQSHYVQERVVEVEKPIYIEKIIEVNGESSEELNFFREKIAVLENNNRQLQIELQAARNTPGQTTQVIVENTDRITELQYEIERLRLQNQEDQDQIKRSKPKNESQAEIEQIRAAYEVQIRELIASNQKLNELLAQQNPENHSLHLQINQLRISGEARNKEYLEKINLLTAEIDRLTRSMKLSREQSDNEINRLNGLLNDRNREIDELRQNQGQSNLHIVKIQEYEQRIAQLNADVERLRAIQSNDTTIIIQQSQQRERELEAQIALRDNQLNELRLKLQEYRQLESAFTEIEKINEQLRRQVEELSNRRVVTEVVQVSQPNNVVLEERVKLLSSQNDQLIRKQQNLEQDTQLLRSRLEENDNIIRNSDNYESKITALLDQTAYLNQLIIQKDQEVQNLRSQLSNSEETVKRSKNVNNNNLEEKLQECELNNVQLRRKIEELVRQISTSEQNTIVLTQQLERLNLIVVEKDTEINRLRGEISNLQITVRSSGVNQEEVNHLNRLLVDKTNEIDALRRRVSEQESALLISKQYETKLVECERNNADLRLKIEQLIAQLNEQVRASSSSDYVRREKAQLEERLANLSVQLELLTKKNQQAEIDANSLRLRNAELENQLRSMAAYETKINLLNEQINNLNLIIAQRDNDLNKLKLEVHSSQVQLRQSGAQREEVNRLNIELNARNREIEDLKGKINELFLTVQRLQSNESRIRDLENLNDSLRRKNDELLAQINEISLEQVKKSSKASQADQLLKEKQMLEERILGLSQRNAQLEQEAYQLRAQLTEQQSANQKLVYDNTKLSDQLQLLAKENDSLRLRITSFEQQILVFSNSDRTIKELQLRIDSLVAQNNGLSDDKLRLSRQISEYELRLRSVASLENNLNFLTQQNEALSLRVKTYEEEITKLTNLLNLIRRSVEEWQIVQTKVTGYNSLVESIRTAISTVQLSSSTIVTRSSNYQV